MRDSRGAVVVGIEDFAGAGAQHLVSAGRTDAFRAARGGLRAEAGGVVLARALAQALNVAVNDRVRHVAF